MCGLVGPCHRQMWLKSQDPRFLSCSSLPDKPLTCGSALLEQSLQLKTMLKTYDSEAESSSEDDAWMKLQKTLIANRAAEVAAKPATCGAGCTTKSETQSADFGPPLQPEPLRLPRARQESQRDSEWRLPV